MIAPRKERPVRHRPEDATRAALALFRDAHQLVGTGPRQRLQQHAVRHAEQHRRRPDAERHRENRDGSEARLTAEQTEAVAQILHEAGERNAAGGGRRWNRRRAPGPATKIRGLAYPDIDKIVDAPFGLPGAAALRAQRLVRGRGMRAQLFEHVSVARVAVRLERAVQPLFPVRHGESRQRGPAPGRTCPTSSAASRALFGLRA